MTENPYQPWLAKIEKIVQENTGERAIKTLRLIFQDDKIKKNFSYLPGQCIMVSHFGFGECFFAISSAPTKKEYIEVSVMKLGKVTSALHECEIGDTLGVRGPYGNNFDVKGWEGKNLVFIGGGIGQAPLRSLINYVVDNRKNYGKIDVIYGARSTNDICFKPEFEELEKRKDVNVHLSIDKEEKGWKKFVGFVPDNLLKIKPSPKNTIAITCGPPIMIKFVIQNLLKIGFSEDQIFTTLEMRMKCGIGKCGRCNIGNLYVCKDGPVFSYDQLKNLKGEM
ncbi:MAG: heterodisulfide reductase subunit F [Thermoplasmata archaeon M9B1D]|nr:MAG: heterodisulfide reductase subunit F [Thermoplasmata archaeon M9B1D]PNX52122.1 MAG: heterodisulfide reductase subunit F [Thermoplasmata archaeon M8B2D]